MSVWFLNVHKVPDRYGGLMTRLGFKPSKYAGSWWALFDPSKPGARAAASDTIAELKNAGLDFKWKQAESRNRGTA
jgi:hypothetical protein